ncbi:MAG TPA: hypothetical protein VLH84_02750 [Patescibacteria group bacterium]|nr:hypothetical protein [Patescibacteria group bacterium]
MPRSHPRIVATRQSESRPAPHPTVVALEQVHRFAEELQATAAEAAGQTAQVTIDASPVSSNEEALVAAATADEAPTVVAASADPQLVIASTPNILTPIEPDADSTPQWFAPEPLPTSFVQAENVKRTALTAIWETELAKKPLHILEDFTVALMMLDVDDELATLEPESEGPIPLAANVLGELQHEPEPASLEELYGELAPTQTHSSAMDLALDKEASSPAVAIRRLVAERLAAAEPAQKEALAPIVQSIAGAVHGLHVLQARAAPPETIAAVAEQLEELCQTLFSALDIEYDAGTAKYFMQSLLRPDFLPNNDQPTALPYDLERDGTREAHRRVLSFVQMAINAEHQLLYSLLGIMTLANYLRDNEQLAARSAI